MNKYSFYPPHPAVE